MPITFRVSEVERARSPLRGFVCGPRELLGRPVEAWGSSAAASLPSFEHGLLQAAHWAFAAHYPLVLTPDAIWLCIAQGFAAHVEANAERLRGKFVRHQGRETISIRRDDFVKGSPENPWPEVFSAFSDAIAAHVGEQRDLVVCDFSTTGPYERAASEIVLMDAMQRYFEYSVTTLCGIPEITLEGTVDDWRSIRRRARALEEYDLDFWTAGLAPVLDQLVATAEGRVDVAFWRSFFKWNDESGGPYLTGWINVLFPYLRRDGGGEIERNAAVSTWAEGLHAEFGGGPEQRSIPFGLSSVPFDWHFLEETFPMELLAGFVGVAQDPETLALRPAIGWAVRDRAPGAIEAPEERRLPYLVGAGVLVAGRISLGDTLTLQEARDVAERVASVAERHGVLLGCAVLAELAPTPCSIMPGKLFIGVHLASIGCQRGWEPVRNLHARIEEVRALPESAWEELGALVPGGLSGESAVHLGWCSPSGSGRCALVLGKPADVENVRGVEVAEVSEPGVRHAIVDMSAAAHEARVTEAEAAGVARGSGSYYLCITRFDEPW
jgi:hypothetical protein